MIIDPNAPIQTIKFRTLTDKKSITVAGEEIVQDSFLYPGSTGPTFTTDTIYLRLSQVPLYGQPVPGYGAFDYIVVELANSPYTQFAGVTAESMLSAGRFLYDEVVEGNTGDTYRLGYIALHPDDYDKSVNIKYYGKGSLICAADINELADGSLIRDEAVRARHIYQGEDFTFGQSVNVLGDINLEGDLNVSGVVNRNVSEVLVTTDDILLLNAGQTLAARVGLEVDRTEGVTGLGATNPGLVWEEGVDGGTGFAGASGSWTFESTDGTPILHVYDNKNVEISTGLFRPPLYSVDPSPIDLSMAWGQFVNTTDGQLKMIKPDGLGGVKIVIIG